MHKFLIEDKGSITELFGLKADSFVLIIVILLQRVSKLETMSQFDCDISCTCQKHSAYRKQYI